MYKTLEEEEEERRKEEEEEEEEGQRGFLIILFTHKGLPRLTEFAVLFEQTFRHVFTENEKLQE